MKASLIMPESSLRWNEIMSGDMGEIINISLNILFGLLIFSSGTGKSGLQGPVVLKRRTDRFEGIVSILTP